MFAVRRDMGRPTGYRLLSAYAPLPRGAQQPRGRAGDPMTDEELKALCEEKWDCEIVNYGGEFASVDGYVIKGGNVIAHIERKVRNVRKGDYPTAILDCRKWVGLLAAEFATGIPSILAYGWDCGRAGFVKPSKGIKVETAICRPALDSVSLNAGVARAVVHIPISEFEVIR